MSEQEMPPLAAAAIQEIVMALPADRPHLKEGALRFLSDRKRANAEAQAYRHRMREAEARAEAAEAQLATFQTAISDPRTGEPLPVARVAEIVRAAFGYL